MNATIDTYPALFWAYNTVWIVLVLYMLWLGSRVARLEKQRKGNSDER